MRYAHLCLAALVVFATTSNAQAGLFRAKQRCQGSTCSPVVRPASTPQQIYQGVSPQSTVQVTTASDPNPSIASEFLGHLNHARTQRGLHPVGYAADLDNDCVLNNAWQRARGLGHFVMGSHRRQNAAVGLVSGSALFVAWNSSPGHAAALYDPTITAVGLVTDGYYSTMGAR